MTVTLCKIHPPSMVIFFPSVHDLLNLPLWNKYSYFGVFTFKDSQFMQTLLNLVDVGDNYAPNIQT